MIRVLCVCGRRFQAQDEHAGKRTKCPFCDNVLVMPAPGSTSEPNETHSATHLSPTSWPPSDSIESGPGSAIVRGDPDNLATTPQPSSSARVSREMAMVVGGGSFVGLVAGLILWRMLAGEPPADALKSVAVAPPVHTVASSPVTQSDASNSPVVSGRAAPASPTESPEAVASTGSTNPPPVEEQADPLPTPKGLDRTKLRLLVPAYFYPGGSGLEDWERLIAASARVPIVLIANPASGPGEQANPDYKAAIGRAARAGIVVVGYLGTDYGRRPRAEIDVDLRRWKQFYPEIRGFFVDGQASQSGQLSYYSDLRDSARKVVANALLIANPGTACTEDYTATSDTLCLFESTKRFEDFRPPIWSTRYPSGQFGAIPHGIAEPDRMKAAIKAAATKRIGLIYVTDAKMPNPWERLPRYWDAEIEAVAEANRPKSP